MWVDKKIEKKADYRIQVCSFLDEVVPFVAYLAISCDNATLTLDIRLTIV
jgi:hypothetical protein